MAVHRLEPRFLDRFECIENFPGRWKSVGVVIVCMPGEVQPMVAEMVQMTVAAAEAAIGLAIIVVYYRNKGTIRVEEISTLKG